MDILNKIIKIPSKIIIKLIEVYQIYVSPDHSPYWSKIRKPACKYYPTCSEYAKEAITELGVIKGSIIGLWRILRCNPWSKGGVDLVKNNKIFAIKNKAK